MNISTEPDWLHEPTKVVVYLDGMSRGLPETQHSQNTRWYLLKRTENLTDRQTAYLREILKYNLNAVRSGL